MAKYKFRSNEYPKDSFVEVEPSEATVDIEVGCRYEGRRNFERHVCTVSRDEAIRLIERVGRDLGLTVTRPT